MIRYIGKGKDEASNLSGVLIGVHLLVCVLFVVDVLGLVEVAADGVGYEEDESNDEDAQNYIDRRVSYILYIVPSAIINQIRAFDLLLQYQGIVVNNCIEPATK